MSVSSFRCSKLIYFFYGNKSIPGWKGVVGTEEVDRTSVALKGTIGGLEASVESGTDSAGQIATLFFTTHFLTRSHTLSLTNTPHYRIQEKCNVPGTLAVAVATAVVAVAVVDSNMVGTMPAVVVVAVVAVEGETKPLAVAACCTGRVDHTVVDSLVALARTL